MEIPEKILVVDHYRGHIPYGQSVAKLLTALRKIPKDSCLVRGQLEKGFITLVFEKELA